MREASGERHRSHVDGRHLGGEHRLDLIARLDSLDDREHEIDSLLGGTLPFAGVDELQRSAIEKVKSAVPHARIRASVPMVGSG